MEIQVYLNSVTVLKLINDGVIPIPHLNYFSNWERNIENIDTFDIELYNLAYSVKQEYYGVPLVNLLNADNLTTYFLECKYADDVLEYCKDVSTLPSVDTLPKEVMEYLLSLKGFEAHIQSVPMLREYFGLKKQFIFKPKGFKFDAKKINYEFGIIYIDGGKYGCVGGKTFNSYGGSGHSGYAVSTANIDRVAAELNMMLERVEEAKQKLQFINELDLEDRYFINVPKVTPIFSTEVFKFVGSNTFDTCFTIKGKGVVGFEVENLADMDFVKAFKVKLGSDDQSNLFKSLGFDAKHTYKGEHLLYVDTRELADMVKEKAYQVSLSAYKEEMAKLTAEATAILTANGQIENVEVLTVFKTDNKLRVTIQLKENEDGFIYTLKPWDRYTDVVNIQEVCEDFNFDEIINTYEYLEQYEYYIIDKDNSIVKL